MLQLLQGSLSQESITVICNPDEGLFPQAGELHFSCSCPDTAEMCKHIAAVLYSVGNRLDNQPELLFLLRGVDATELIAAKAGIPSTNQQDILHNEDLSALFGIELESIPELKELSEVPQETGTTQGFISIVSNSPEQKEGKTQQEFPLEKTTVSPAKEKTPVQLFFIQAPQEDKKIFTGKDIVRLRACACLSVSQFAHLLGVTQTTIYRWEHSGELKLQPASRERLLRLRKSLQEKNNPNNKIS